jgi:hypothetical protein
MSAEERLHRAWVAIAKGYDEALGELQPADDDYELVGRQLTAARRIAASVAGAASTIVDIPNGGIQRDDHHAFGRKGRFATGRRFHLVSDRGSTACLAGEPVEIWALDDGPAVAPEGVVVALRAEPKRCAMNGDCTAWERVAEGYRAALAVGGISTEVRGSLIRQLRRACELASIPVLSAAQIEPIGVIHVGVSDFSDTPTVDIEQWEAQAGELDRLGHRRLRVCVGGGD